MSDSGMPTGFGGGFGAGFPGMPPMFGQQDRPMPQSRPTGGSNGGINIDDLVKKIDAKIAALEEEEKAEANKPVKDVKPVKPEKEKATSSTMDINKLEERINEGQNKKKQFYYLEKKIFIFFILYNFIIYWLHPINESLV